MKMTPKLFTPLQVGNLLLEHRVVLAPLTRFKSDANDVPFPICAEYYAQRASTPGSLLITEATIIARRARGYPHVPGIWSPEQIRAWKLITDGIHAKGSFVFMQLWAVGRAATPEVLHPDDPYVSASDVKLTGKAIPPRPLTIPEIKEYVALYVQAARNALEAGCDGVELHNGNGYLLDQFLQENSNKRTDEYGGSIENRARLTLEVVDAVVAAIGAEKTAIRFSPWSPFQDMRMPDPLPTFTYVLTQLADSHPDLAYVHLIEPRVAGPETCDVLNEAESNAPLVRLWAPRPLVRAGGFTRATALEAAEEEGAMLVAFGRPYIANPDLPVRLEKEIPLNPYDRSTFYLIGEDGPKGYTDQPFAVQVGA